MFCGFSMRLARLTVPFEDFRFNATQWYGAMRSDIEVPADVVIRVLLDPAFSAQPSSDKSALLASYMHTREDDGVPELVVLDGRSDRWKGMKLADATIDFCELWKPGLLRIERIVGVDLLIDAIRLKCELRGIDPPVIGAFAPSTRKSAKNLRIFRLQSLFGEPPAIQIRRGAYVDGLIEEVEAFVPSPQNRGRQINLLDCLALSAGFR
jgi:hypothetical protein